MRYKFYSLRFLLENSSKTQIKKLLKTFKCEKNEDLKKFLHHKAILFELKGRSRTYLYIDIKEKKVMAYFTVSISSLYVKNFSKETISYLYGEENKIIECIPCYLIGQLGKNDECKIKIGNNLLNKAVNVIMESHYILNGRFILLDAINNDKIIKLYERNGFIGIEKLKKEKEVIKMIYWLV